MAVEVIIQASQRVIWGEQLKNGLSSSNQGIHGWHDHSNNKNTGQKPAGKTLGKPQIGMNGDQMHLTLQNFHCQRSAHQQKVLPEQWISANCPEEVHQNPLTMAQCRLQRHWAGGTTQAGYNQWPPENQQHCSSRQAEALVLSIQIDASTVDSYHLWGHTMSRTMAGKISGLKRFSWNGALSLPMSSLVQEYKCAKQGWRWHSQNLWAQS